jgi:hypothetical protein
LIKKEPKKAKKETKLVKPEKKPAKKAKKASGYADDGLIIIDEEFKEDKEAELEARKAYLEEARSQEVDD